jgi:hypothetical protein
LHPQFAWITRVELLLLLLLLYLHEPDGKYLLQQLANPTDYHWQVEIGGEFFYV